MLFNSLQFALFFPLVCAAYFALPHRWRTLFLLLASCVFYMAFIPAYIAILAITILIDYAAGLGIEATRGRKRTLLLAVSIAATCAVLFVFKYYAFFTHAFTGFAGLIGWSIATPALNLILPIGLSFHTFQSLSYVIEVYRGHQRAERDFIVYATYVMFFPQLVAGPIERPQNLLHQFRTRHTFEYNRVTSGLKRMAWGFFKKLVVADRLALYVNDVYAAPQACNGLQLTLATLFFAYQIYCDFSGYSDIAIGTARILGFTLMENFDTPYASQSIGEFWRRWHISLSTWFRDYVYIELGGSRVSRTRHYFNLLVTFGVSGLWHGANWTYVIWGLLNGAYLVFGTATARLRTGVGNLVGLPPNPAIARFVGIGTTFVLTCLAWVLFRARSLGDAVYVYTHLFSGWNLGALKTEHFQLKHFPAAFGAILLLQLLEVLRPRLRGVVLPQWPTYVRWPAYVGFTFVVILFGVYRSNQFIYFQF